MCLLCEQEGNSKKSKVGKGKGSKSERHLLLHAAHADALFHSQTATLRCPFFSHIGSKCFLQKKAGVLSFFFP